MMNIIVRLLARLRLPVFILTTSLLLIGGCSTSLQAGKTFRDCTDCPQMVVVPPGSILTGATAEEHAREAVLPEMRQREALQQVVIPQAFAVGRYEITRGDYARFIAATARSETMGCNVLTITSNQWGPDPLRSWRDPGFAQTDQHPVVCISWQDARAYVAWLARLTGQPYRLLTEAEWEYAARAGVYTARYWGDTRAEACTYANAADLSLADALQVIPSESLYVQCRDSFAHTAPVGSFAANAFGLHDMQGNVWEWTEACESMTASQSIKPSIKPSIESSIDVSTAPAECDSHVDRGGSWVNSPKYLRLAARHKDFTTMRNSVLGLRIMRPL